MGSFRDLIVFQKAFELALDLFEASKTFPQEEKYGLVKQIRNSSRSVCSCIGEGYRKRIYEKHFVAKISDADMENTETQVWLDFALAHGYLEKSTYETFLERSREIGRMLDHMVKYPEKFKRKT